jgi:transcriptional regulator with XRE-family HTH domain
MGYRGKLREQEEARRLRAQNLTLQDIADQLGGAKSSVSLWVRDVPFTPSKRR